MGNQLRSPIQEGLDPDLLFAARHRDGAMAGDRRSLGRTRGGEGGKKLMGVKGVFTRQGQLPFPSVE
jgi:hypothetical protein